MIGTLTLSPLFYRMSLFKARDWWALTLGEGEEFDQGCLCVGDVDNSGSGYGELKHLLPVSGKVNAL